MKIRKAVLIVVLALLALVFLAASVVKWRGFRASTMPQLGLPEPSPYCVSQRQCQASTFERESIGSASLTKRSNRILVQRDLLEHPITAFYEW